MMTQSWELKHQKVRKKKGENIREKEKKKEERERGS